MQKSELTRRAAALQAKMGQLGLDGVLLAQNMSMYYFSGTMQCQYVYVPAAGESLGLVRKNLARAEVEAGISVVPVSGFSDVGAAIAACGTPRRLGVETDILPAEIYFRLQKVFPEAELLNAAPAIREVRQVKSAYELEQFRLAAQQVDTLYRQIPQLLQIGKKEIAFAAECEAILRAQGHQGISRMRRFNSEMYYGHILSGAEGAEASFVESPTGGQGLSPVAPYGAGHKRFAAKEPITVDYAGIYGGYVLDQTRLYSFGQLPPLLTRAFDAALEIQETVKQLLLPGITGGEIYAAAAVVAQKLGLAEHFMGVGRTQAPYVGHGVGLEFDEYPVLGKNSPHKLTIDTVVAVEPKFTFPGLGVVGLENTWHVTASGPVKLSLTADGHVIL